MFASCNHKLPQGLILFFLHALGKKYVCFEKGDAVTFLLLVLIHSLLDANTDFLCSKLSIKERLTPVSGKRQACSTALGMPVCILQISDRNTGRENFNCNLMY